MVDMQEPAAMTKSEMIEAIKEVIEKAGGSFPDELWIPADPNVRVAWTGSSWEFIEEPDLLSIARDIARSG